MHGSDPKFTIESDLKLRCSEGHSRRKSDPAQALAFEMAVALWSGDKAVSRRAEGHRFKSSVCFAAGLVSF